MASNSNLRNKYRKLNREDNSNPYSEVLEQARKTLPEGARLTRS